MKAQTSCDSCMNYEYDEEYECYECQVNMDEDELGNLLSNPRNSCPYYQLGDEYKIVRKQM